MKTLKVKRTGPVIFSGYKRGDAIRKTLSMTREDILFEIKKSNAKWYGLPPITRHIKNKINTKL